MSEGSPRRGDGLTGRKLAACAVTLAAMLLARPCPAPVYGEYLGTEWMLRAMDAIVIADVGELCLPEDIRRRLERDEEWAARSRGSSFGFHDQHECRIVRVLKGPLEEGDACISLRWPKPPSGFRMPLWTRHAPSVAHGAGAQGTYLVFLLGEPQLQSYNSIGSILPVPDGFMPGDIDGMTLDEAVHFIVGDIQESESVVPFVGKPDGELRRSRLETVWKQWRNLCDAKVGILQIPGERRYPRTGAAEPFVAPRIAVCEPKRGFGSEPANVWRRAEAMRNPDSLPVIGASH